MIKKPTFKKGKKETGLAAIANSYQTTNIKYNKKHCGYIYPPNYRSDKKWTISLMVVKNEIFKDNNPNCKWKWISLKADFKTEEIARKMLIENWEKIIERYPLYLMDK